MMDGFGMYGAGWLIGMSMMIFFWLAVILLVVWAVRRMFPQQLHSKGGQALEILQRRYAAGEISAAEYEKAHSRLEELPVASR